jgi:hypothetical protein
MRKRSVFFLLVIFIFFASSYIYSQSSFIVHEISAEAENDLELAGYHINKVSERYLLHDQNSYQGYFQEYVVNNNGNVPHKAEFGFWYQYESDIPSELFRVNGVTVRHQLALLDELEEFELSFMTIGYFAFIEVEFPAHEETKIRVNDFPSIYRSYNSFIFKGSPRFTATIGNQWMDPTRLSFEIENDWINDILLNDHRVSLVSMLEQKGSLSNDLFTIQKTDENTWEIEFTRQFVDAYRPNLTVDLERGAWGFIMGGYNPSGGSNRGLVFNSEESITPYQYIFLTNRQLQVLRNAYYARHGYIFKNTELARMYEGFPDSNFGNINYRENPDFTESMLTETDRANIAIIQRLEALAGVPVEAYAPATPEAVSESPPTGAAVEESPEGATYSAAEGSSPGSRFSLVIILIGGAVVLAAVVILLVVRKKKK